MSERLFVYGTLHPDRAPAEIAEAARKLQWLGTGTVRGRLYLLQGYPGLVRDESAEQVHGHVFAVPSPALWGRFDAYEGFRPGDEAGSLFLRQTARVEMDRGGALDCWVYDYNGPLPGEPI